MGGETPMEVLELDSPEKGKRLASAGKTVNCSSKTNPRLLETNHILKNEPNNEPDHRSKTPIKLLIVQGIQDAEECSNKS